MLTILTNIIKIQSNAISAQAKKKKNTQFIIIIFFFGIKRI
jgi:hypothetical protein